MDSNGADHTHDDLPPVSWTSLQLWRALSFIVSSGNNEVPFNDLRDQVFDGKSKPIVDLISHDLLGFELANQSPGEVHGGGSENDAFWYVSTASPCVGVAFKHMLASPRWQLRMKALSVSVENEALHKAIDLEKCKVRAKEKRIETQKESLLKSIELGTSIDPSGDPNVESHADGGQ